MKADLIYYGGCGLLLLLLIGCAWAVYNLTHVAAVAVLKNLERRFPWMSV